MARKKKPVKKKKNKEKKPEIESKQKYDVPSVALPPHQTEKDINGNTIVGNPPWEIHSHYLTSVLDHFERQLKWGPTQHFPLIIHGIRSCLNDKYHTITSEFNFANQIVNKTRPFLAMHAPEVQAYYDNKMKRLFFQLVKNPHFPEILSIPGVEFILFDMDLLSTSALPVDHVSELDCQDFVDKAMFHLGLLVFFGCRRLVESKTSYAKRAVARLMALNSCPRTRFSTAYRLSECLAEMYDHEEFLKHVHSTDCIGGLFMDIAENPILTDLTINLMYNLNDKCWYNASIQALSLAFEYVLTPWLSGYFSSTNFKFEHDSTLDGDLEGLFWLLTSSKHFFTFIAESKDKSPCISKLKQLSKDCEKKEFSAEKREYVYKHAAKWKQQNCTEKRLNDILEDCVAKETSV